MPAAKCTNCGDSVTHQWFPFCPKCRLLVIDQSELDLSPTAEIRHIYNDRDEPDPNGNTN